MLTVGTPAAASPAAVATRPVAVHDVDAKLADQLAEREHPPEQHERSVDAQVVDPHLRGAQALGEVCGRPEVGRPAGRIESA